MGAPGAAPRPPPGEVAQGVGDEGGAGRIPTVATKRAPGADWLRRGVAGRLLVGDAQQR